MLRNISISSLTLLLLGLPIVLHTDELGDNILDSIKAIFEDKAITVTVSAVMDETEYLLSSPANKAHLEQSIKDLEEGKGITFSLEEFQEKYGADANAVT